MKFLSFVILLFHAQHSFTCNQPITLQVGPFFSTTFIQKYWMDFALEIEIQMSCQVKVLASSSYEQYLDTLINHQGDIFIVPNHYVKSLVKNGLRPVIRSTDDAQLYIVSSHDIKTHGPSILVGETILVPSRYTRAYLELKNWLKENQLENKIQFNFDHSHDSATLLMLKGKYSTAVVLGHIYESFPESIKSKFPVIKLEGRSGGSILTKNNADSALTKAILKAKAKLNILNWDKAATPQSQDPFSDVFSDQLNQHIKSKATQ